MDIMNLKIEHFPCYIFLNPVTEKWTIEDAEGYMIDYDDGTIVDFDSRLEAYAWAYKNGYTVYEYNQNGGE